MKLLSIVLMLIGILVMVYSVAGGLRKPKSGGHLEKLLEKQIHPRIDINVVNPKKSERIIIFIIGIMVFFAGVWFKTI